MPIQNENTRRSVGASRVARHFARRNACMDADLYLSDARYRMRLGRERGERHVRSAQKAIGIAERAVEACFAGKFRG